ncbi:MAG: hypothetical protein WA666_09485 [Nitrospirota bacterium]
MKYEYKIICQYVSQDVDKEKNEKELNQLGQAGWKMAGLASNELDRIIIYLTRETS